MSKRTKASKKRLNDLLIVLLLTAVLLVMSTYAWFTANRKVNIDKLDVKVVASSGLQISADGSEWKTVLEKTDLIGAAGAGGKYAGAVNQLPTYMKPVSTVGTVDSTGFMEMYLGEVTHDLTSGSPTYDKDLLAATKQTDKDINSVSSSTDAEAGAYMAFDIFLRYDNGQQDGEHLHMTGSVIEDTTEGTTNKQLENAARIAVYKGGVCPASDVELNDGANVRSTARGTNMTATIWEPNCDAHNQKSIDNADAYGEVMGASQGPIAYDGIKSAFALTNSVELYKTKASLFATQYPSYFGDVTVQATGKSATPDIELDKLSAGATRYRVYMWIEGQDYDCQNYASGMNLLYNLSFSLDPITSNP